jgi:hypothetical protein
VGEVEAWVTATLCGPEAEADLFGDAPVEADERVIGRLVGALRLKSA